MAKQGLFCKLITVTKKSFKGLEASLLKKKKKKRNTMHLFTSKYFSEHFCNSQVSTKQCHKVSIKNIFPKCRKNFSIHQYRNHLAIRNPPNNIRPFWKKYSKNFIVNSVFNCTMYTVKFLNKLYLSYGIQERQQDFYMHGPLLKSSDSALKFFNVPDVIRYFLILYFFK